MGPLGPLERVMRTKYTTYKPYEKATIATSQYRYYGTPVLTLRYSSTDTMVLQYRLRGTKPGTEKRREEYTENKEKK